MNAHPAWSTACPLGAVDRRLADSHQLWHQAETAYFDPDRFRLAAQSVIQTLRSVTFILQSNKEIIPNFREWYGDYVDKKHGKRGRWQERLYAGPLMRWLVHARNWIEKQGDLESHSFIRAEIVASYLDEGPRIEVPAELFQDPGALLRTIPKGSLGEHIWRYGVLRLQRLWVENSLPNHELLDALAVAYGKLAELVHDAHRQIGLSPPEAIHGEAGERYDLPAMGWRMPCMIAHNMPRTLFLALSDGTRIEFQEKRVPKTIPATKAAELLANLAGDPRTAMAREYRNYEELAAGWFEMIRAVFLKDGYHLTILFLFRNMRLIRFIQINVENAQQKYLVMRRVASEVTKSGADATMMVGEMWMAPLENIRPYERVADAPLRKEALSLLLARKSGDPIDCMALINRDGITLALGETVMSTPPSAFELAPFYEAWGRPVPRSWIEASVALLRQGKSE